MTTKVQCGFEVKQAEMPLVTDTLFHGGTRDAPERQQGRDHRATLHLLRLQWIAVDFIGICIPGNDGFGHPGSRQSTGQL